MIRQTGIFLLCFCFFYNSLVVLTLDYRQEKFFPDKVLREKVFFES